MLWIGTDGGLSRLAGDTTIVVGQPELVTENIVRSLWKDREGSLWIGTRSGGLARMRPRKIAVFGASEGLADDLTWVIYEDRAANVWIGTNRGLTRIDQHGVRSYGTRYAIRSIFEDRRGELWFGTQTHGLARLEDGELRTYGLVAGPTQPRISCFGEDSVGDLWVGTDGGLYRRAGGLWRDETTSVGLVSSIVRDLYVDPQGVLWIDAGSPERRNGTLRLHGLP